jgi:hypothetical protein
LPLRDGVDVMSQALEMMILGIWLIMLAIADIAFSVALCILFVLGLSLVAAIVIGVTALLCDFLGWLL